MDKEAYIRKQAKQSKSAAQFDGEITRFKNQQSDIYGETSMHTINFVRVDCNVLKDALVGQCLQCQAKLTTLLNQIAVVELNDIYELFRKSKETFTDAPLNLDVLSNKIAHCRELKDSMGSTQVSDDRITYLYLYFRYENHRPCSYHLVATLLYPPSDDLSFNDCIDDCLSRPVSSHCVIFTLLWRNSKWW